MPRADFYIKQGDTDSVITATLRNAAREAVDIANATVHFQMTHIDGGGPTIDKDATVDQSGDGSNGTKGRVSFTWEDGDTDVPGWYLGEWRVVFGDLSVQTYPNAEYVMVLIKESIAT